jgi:phospholipid/cholesterol/gamma-HCH transport system substrate-binding protein
MESEARYIRVGVATLLLTALLVGGLFWLAGRTGHQAQERYTIYFRVQSLEGLQINSDVRMQGIKVGKVIDYAIMPGEAHKVRVVIQVDARTPVLKGVKAIISRQILTGLAAIDLDTPPDAKVPLARALDGEPYPVIPEGVSQLAKMTDTMQTLSQSLQESMTRFNTLLSDHNQQAVANTLNNLDRLSDEASKTMPEFQAAMTSIHQAADQVGELSEKTRTTLDQAGHQLGRLTGQAADTLAAVNKSAADMSVQINDLSGRVALTADLAGQQIDTTAQSLGQAGNTLQDTGRALSDPARALFGPSPYELGPGEEIRK